MNTGSKLKLSALILSSTLLVAMSTFAANIDEVPTLLAANKNREAILILKGHLQTEPKDYKARQILFNIYLSEKDYIKAEKELKQLKAMNAPSEVWLVPLVRLYELSNDADKMLNTIGTVDAETLSNETDWGQNANALKASAEIIKGNLKKANAILVELLKVNPNHIEALLNLSRVQALSEKMTEASKTLEKALSLNKKNKNAKLTSRLYTTKAELARARENFSEAKIAYQTAIDADKNNILALIGLTSLNLQEKNKADFMKTAEILYTKAPHYPKAMFYKALILLDQKKTDAALALLEKANQEDASDSGVQFILGKLYYAKHQYERADQILSIFVKNNPKYMPALGILAAVKIKLQQPEMAVKLLSPYVSSKTKDYRLLALLGSANVMAGHADEGTKLLSLAAKSKPDNAGIKTELALGYLASGQSELAQDALEDVIHLDSNVLQADVLLIFTAINNQEYSKAELVAKSLIKKAPNNPVPYNLLGLAEAKQKLYQSAKENFKIAISKNKKFINAYNNLAEVYILEKNYPKAKSILLEALAENQAELESLLLMSKTLELSGDEIGALEYLDKAIGRNPTQVMPGYEKVKYYLRNYQTDKALSYAKELQIKFPNHVETTNLIANVALNMQDYPLAKENYKQLTKMLPKQPLFWQGLARAELGLNAYQEANAAIEQASLLKANNPVTLLIEAEIAFKTKNYDKALNVGKTLLKNNQRLDIAHHLIGDALFASGKTNEAIDAYQKSLDIKENPAVLKALYRAKEQVGQLDEGIRLIENWLNHQPEDTDMRRFAAFSYLEKGDEQAARKHYEVLIQENASDYIALNNLAAIYMKSDPKRAVELAKRAYKEKPNNSKIADTLGYALIQNGQAAQGLPYIRQSLELEDQSETRYHLAVGLNVIGDKNGAKIEVEKALEASKLFHSHQEAQKLLENLTKTKG